MLRREAWWAAELAQRLQLRAASSASAPPDVPAPSVDLAAIRAQRRRGATGSALAATAPQTRACRSTQSEASHLLPSSCAFEFVDSAYDQLLLDASKPIDENRAIEMV